MASYEIAYEDQGTTLALKADLNAGWRKLTKTYGLNGSQKIYYKRGSSIRAQLALIAQPSTFADNASLFPDISLEAGDGLVAFAITQKRLTVKVRLVPEQPWRIMSTNRPRLFIEELPLLTLHPQLWFDLRA